MAYDKKRFILEGLIMHHYYCTFCTTIYLKLNFEPRVLVRYDINIKSTPFVTNIWLFKIKKPILL